MARVECGGIPVYDGSSHNAIRSNVVSRSGCDGIAIWSRSRDNLVSGNTVRHNDAGIGVGMSSRTRVVANAADDNRLVGIYLFGADQNLVKLNVMIGNGDGSEGGIHVLADDSAAPSDQNMLQDNIVVRTTGDGILVERGSIQTTLLGNMVVASTDDGIDVGSTATTLGLNAANHNVALGIDAAAGVTDAGGNRPMATVTRPMRQRFVSLSDGGSRLGQSVSLVALVLAQKR